MNIILIGMPYCGKTQISQMLSVRLNWNLIDTDRCVEELWFEEKGEQKCCRAIYIKNEKQFRRIESKAIGRLKNITNTVISTGGGSLLNPKNAEALKKLGPLVLIHTTPRVLYPRILKNGIPPYLDPNDPEGSFMRLYRERRPIYEQWANFIIMDDDFSLDYLTTTIEERYGKQ